MIAAMTQDRVADMLVIAAAVYCAVAAVWIVRACRDAREVRVRLQRHQARAIRDDRALSCQLCHEPSEDLGEVELADAVTFVCPGCRELLVAGVGA